MPQRWRNRPRNSYLFFVVQLLFEIFCNDEFNERLRAYFVRILPTQTDA
jgi:hypothetical protein